ncbi:MAG: DUF3109 family protein [Flavobacteriales bacterium]|nr:DUF3109 family protein [Flavobacteriales bacterium]MCB9190839.1 DUF3109 family protein [Flavobacteriales bacterium]MCB9204867.1 DUF3109 family protein [Flavobacteriales bacterium]
MLAIQNTLVSLDLLERYFVCDLNACKGACCVKGDAGAPLTDEEINLLEDIIDDILPYLDEEGKAMIAKKGVFEIDVDGDKGTSLLENGRCAYALVDQHGMVSCGIEKAHNEGNVDFKKPISCHLYPVRITEYESYDAVNYNKWSICKPACDCGAKLDVPLFKFLKEALTRKYGDAWYEELEMIDQLRRKKDQ